MRGGLEKKGYRGILEEEASRHGVRVFYHTMGAQWGRAALGSRRIFVPRPARFTSFFTGLHELGHIMSSHHAGDGKPEYIWEFEAFTWAVHFCENRGITVPARIIKNERNIIAEKLKEQADSGAKQLDTTVVRFVKEGDDNDPDVEFVKRFVSNDGTVLASRPK
jgi:hypothetical protein